MVLHSYACLYVWYASNMTTFIANHFASFLCFVIKIYKIGNDRCCRFHVCVLNLWLLFGWAEVKLKQRARFGSSKTCLSPFPQVMCYFQDGFSVVVP